VKTPTRSAIRLLSVAGLSAMLAGAAAGQTSVTASNNKYTPAEDVELGRQAAAEVEQQLPILKNKDVTPLLTTIGSRLVAVIPRDLRHEEFHYTFQVVNVSEINAFALPGGPMYVNRGMIEAAHTQGEVAGVMAHELSHVALRHGTAQATKATKYEIGTFLGAIVGAVIGGNVGSAVAQGTQFGLGTAFLRFSREFEREADLLGSQMMAAAGYDPLEMASMFDTLAEQGGSNGPTWLSDHPDPGDRSAAITREAKQLTVRNRVRDTRPFTRAQSRLDTMAPAPTTEEATRTSAGREGAPTADRRLDPARVEPPSSGYTAYSEGDVFRVSAPSNWRELPESHHVLFAPDGAFGSEGGRGVFTHGMEIGVAPTSATDIRAATNELLTSLGRSNPNLGRPSPYRRATIGGRRGRD
jgi:predicted Zn-dependent protease